MLRYAMGRLGVAVLVVLVVSVIVFGLTHIAADPARAMAGENATAADVEAIRKAEGFDRPLPVQYLEWIARAASGDFGRSYLMKEPAVELVVHRLPITLSLIYKVVGERAGVKIRGLGLPGHFCAGVETDEGIMIVDPFYSGRLLNPNEALERVRDTYGSEIEWSDDVLRPVSNRHWLTRIMQNLLHTFSERDRLTDVAAMLELEILLWPEQSHLQRDLALVLARAGQTNPASRWLGSYLAANPNDPQRDDLEQLLDVLSP